MLRAVKWKILRYLGTRGYHVIPEWRVNEGCLGIHLQKLFRTAGIDCVIDVGANEGQYRDFLREVVGYSGPIVSFEPNADLVKMLNSRAAAEKDRSWKIFGIALGAKDGSQRFNIMESSEFSSFLEPDHSSVSTFDAYNVVVATPMVDMKTLDSVYPPLKREMGITAPYLKIDTQGYDVPVIEGARTVLSDFVALQTEASVKPVYKNAPNYRETMDLLDRLGFDLSGMYRVTDAEFPRLVEFDCVVVNRHKIEN